MKLYIMKPEQVSGKPGVLLFVHGGVWIVGNFENHQRLLRDLVVGSGQIGVFVEYTSLPRGKIPDPARSMLCGAEVGRRRMPTSSAQTAAGSPWPAIRSAAT